MLSEKCDGTVIAHSASLAQHWGLSAGHSIVQSACLAGQLGSVLDITQPTTTATSVFSNNEADALADYWLTGTFLLMWFACFASAEPTLSHCFSGCHHHQHSTCIVGATLMHYLTVLVHY